MHYRGGLVEVLIIILGIKGLDVVMRGLKMRLSVDQPIGGISALLLLWGLS